MNRGGALAVVLAMLAGAALGLFYAWVISPVKYVDTAPASLRADFQADYLTLIAAAYSDTGDLVRARARLAGRPGLRLRPPRLKPAHSAIHEKV